MSRYSTTAISITHLKEALLYFDAVIPVNLVAEAVREGWRQQVPVEEFRLDVFLPSKTLLNEMLPPDLRDNGWFRERLRKANVAMQNLLVRTHQPKKNETEENDLEIVEGVAKWMVYRVVDDFGLTDVPIIVPARMVKSASDNDADVAISLASLNLIDAESATWEQLLEFRRDAEARAKLRRLRLFAYENYSGKSKQFIEDDLLTRINDYHEAVRKWRFDCKSGIFTALLNSKLVQGGLGVSVLSSLCHEPLAAIASAGGAVVLELGRTLLEIRKQQFTLRDLMRTNPVSYIADANEKLEPPRN